MGPFFFTQPNPTNYKPNPCPYIRSPGHTVRHFVQKFRFLVQTRKTFLFHNVRYTRRTRAVRYISLARSYRSSPVDSTLDAANSLMPTKPNPTRNVPIKIRPNPTMSGPNSCPRLQCATFSLLLRVCSAPLRHVVSQFPEEDEPPTEWAPAPPPPPNPSGVADRAKTVHWSSDNNSSGFASSATSPPRTPNSRGD